jgi:3-oxoacyl-[acyl-carrier protein] reductase
MTLPLEHRTALITGSSRGIGAAIARKLAAHGARVVVHGARHMEAARAVAAEIVQSGGEAQVLQADLAVPQAAIELVRSSVALLTGLDILVNNAAVSKAANIGEVTDEQIDSMLAVNLRSVLLTTREYAILTRSRCGRVVNISSIAARTPSPRGSVYAATKAAVESLTRSHAVEFGPRGITVNTVAPGVTETDMSLAGYSASEQRLIAGASALGRLGKPEDIADVVAFLCSDEGAWVTGQVIGADGGQLSSAFTLLRVADAAKSDS